MLTPNDGLEETGDVSGKRKRSASKDEEPSSDCATRLHNVCAQILGRSVEPGDIVYKTYESDDGRQVAELFMHSLPMPWGAQSWTSAACASKRIARLQAAETALLSLAYDPQIAAASVFQSKLSSRAAGSRSASKEAERDVGSTSGDAKTDVVIFCQRSCGRPMRSDDIVYTVSREGGQYVAMVKLRCFAGECFTGELRYDRRQAEQDAAEKVLQAFAKERASLGQRAPKRRKVHSDVMGEEIAPDVRRQLHEVCTQILGRAPQAGDIMYEVVPGNSGPTATLRLPCLQGEFGTQVWVSPPCASKTEARLRVASMALRSLCANSGDDCPMQQT